MRSFSLSRRRSPALGVLALLAVVACKCGQGPAKPAEEFLDKAVPGVLFVPSLGDLADHAQALLSSARTAPGGGTLIELSADLARQLDFDPLSRDGLKKAGLDPSRAMAGSGFGRSEELLVLPYSDLTKLDATVTRLAKDKINLPVRKSQTVNGLTVVTYAKDDSAKPTLAYTTAGGNLLFAGGGDPVAVVTAAATRTPEASIARDPAYASAKTKVGQRDLYLYNLSPERPLLFSVPASTMTGVAMAAKELAVKLYVPLAAEKASKFSQIMVGGETELTKLPAGQPVYMRGGVDWAALLKQSEDAVRPALASHPGAVNPYEKVREFFKQAGIDFDSEIAGNLQPGFAFTIGISPNADLSNALRFDPSRVNPFQNYTVAGVGKVKDAEKAKATMEKMSKLVETIGAKMSTSQVNGGTVYTASYALGEGLSWTLRGNDLLVTGGYGDKLAGVITALTGVAPSVKQAAFPPRTGTMLFSNQGLALALDFAKIDEAVQGASAGSQSPGVEVVRRLINDKLHQFSALRPAVQVAPAEGGIAVEAAISLQ